MAKESGNNYILNGTKAWITNGVESKATVVFATTDKAKKHKGISSFWVPKPIEGNSSSCFTVDLLDSLTNDRMNMYE